MTNKITGLLRNKIEDPLANLEFAYYKHLSQKEQAVNSLKEVRSAREIYKKKQELLTLTAREFNNHALAALKLENEKLALATIKLKKLINLQHDGNNLELNDLQQAEKQLQKSITMLELRMQILTNCMDVIKGQQRLATVYNYARESVISHSDHYTETFGAMKKIMAQVEQLIKTAPADKHQKLTLLLNLYAFSEQVERLFDND